jgi:hypothetical protein
MKNSKTPSLSFISFIIYLAVTIFCIIFNDSYIGHTLTNFLYAEFDTGDCTVKLSLLFLFVVLTFLDRYISPSKSWRFKGLIGFIVVNIGVYILMKLSIQT